MATPKIIPYQVKLRSTTIERSLVRPIVYTNDLRSAEFQFQVTDMQAGELSGATATTLLYMRDGSFFQNPKEDVELTGTTFSYLLKEDEGNHAGIARIQLVVRFNEGFEDEQNFPSQLYDFEIVNGLETQVAQQIMIHDWTTLTREARAYIDEFAANEILREAEFDNNEFDRNAAFNLAQTNRQNQFSYLAEDLTATLAAADANIEEFDVALETGIAAAKLAEKLEDFEEINNSRLLSTERQLADVETAYQTAAANLTLDSEVILARNSSAKNKSYVSLGTRIEETEGDINANATNFVQNGDFSSGTNDWLAGASALSASNNTLFVTGNGVDYNPKARQVLADLTGKKVYLRARARVRGSGCTIMFLRTNDVAVSANVSNPVVDQWYDLIAYARIAASSEISINHRYADAVSANGKIMEVQFVTAIEVTTVFGTGKEPTLEQLNYLISRFSNGWFDGTRNLYQSKQEIAKRLELEGSIAAVDGRITSEMAKNINGLTSISATNQTYSDANNVPNNRIVRYIIAGCPNVPSNGLGTLLTYAYSDDTGIGGRVQIFVDEAGKVFSRMYWSSVWRDWFPASEEQLFKQLGTVTTVESPYYDANLVLTNRVVRYGGVGLNIPATAGTLFCYVPDSGQINGTSQTFISNAGDYYFRYYWNTWFTWKKISTTDMASALDYRDYYASFSMFESVGVIGDSYASGAFGETPEALTATDHYNKSWPQMLGRKNGVQVTNYTKGGMSTRSWLVDANYGLPKLLTDTPSDIYILALIRNDYNIENRGETGYKGTIADITGYANFADYPDSFYGNYGKIIEQIKIHSPNAKLILMTGDYTSSNTLGTAYNAAVVEIASHYGLPTMIQLEESYFSSSFYRSGWPAGGHPGAMQYSGMELAIERMFQKAVLNNKAYFTY